MQQPLGYVETVRIQVGGLTRAQLRASLLSRDVHLNGHAEALLEHPVFDLRDREEIGIVECEVGDFDLRKGGTLPEVFAAARDRGLALCPPDTGPYLRLALTSQANAPDSVLSAGRSPAGALKVAAAPLSDDVEFPKGFYLRVVDDRQWLRGFRCDDEYRFALEDRFAFRLPDQRMSQPEVGDSPTSITRRRP
ncbi:hypothetical protein [Leifsonia sp. Leaf336]|uniref:hypothetical protein n=1 Tax=Leifsonia sp. Leaf336 TaxID=1736341 RepID=UPI000A4D4EFA|nr:hypothetical protein [Leifsonia sp. Leaf336]